MELGGLGIRLIGTCFSLALGGMFISFSVIEDSPIVKLCLKVAGTCLIIGGILLSWFLKI